MWTKFTDLVRWLVTWAKDTLPGLKEDIDKKYDEIVGSTGEAEEFAKEAEKSAEASEASAKKSQVSADASRDFALQSEAAILPLATREVYGKVKLADSTKVPGNDDVIAFKDFQEQVINTHAYIDFKTPPATTSAAGISKLATLNEVLSKTGNSVLTAAMVDYITTQPDLSDLITIAPLTIKSAISGNATGNYFSVKASNKEFVVLFIEAIFNNTSTNSGLIIVALPHTLTPIGAMPTLIGVVSSGSSNSSTAATVKGSYNEIQIYCPIVTGITRYNVFGMYVRQSGTVNPPTGLASNATDSTVNISWEDN